MNQEKVTLRLYNFFKIEIDIKINLCYTQSQYKLHNTKAVKRKSRN